MWLRISMRPFNGSLKKRAKGERSKLRLCVLKEDGYAA